MEVGPELVTLGEYRQWSIFPPRILTLDQVETVGMEYEEATVYEAIISRRLLREPGHPATVQFKGTETPGGLDRGDRRQSSVRAVEPDQGRHVDVG